MSDSKPLALDDAAISEPLASPGSPGSESSSQASTPLDPPPMTPPPMTESSCELPKRVPSLRSASDTQAMHPSSTPLGTLNSARRPAAAALLGGNPASDALLKARNLAAQRRGMPSPSPSQSPLDVAGRISPAPPLLGGLGNMRLPAGVAVRPGPPISTQSAPSGVKSQGLGARRGMKLSMAGGPSPGLTPKLSDMDGAPGAPNGVQGSKLDDFKKYIDAEKGWITFEGAATITDKGVNFSNGKSFQISLGEVTVLSELGKGNYGTVYMVRHAKPSKPHFRPGLSGFRQSSVGVPGSASSSDVGSEPSGTSSLSPNTGRNCTGVVMAMKEIRLELDEAKFTTILKELVILHECVSPYIIDFYGAFFQDGAVYMCIEYMDGGSIDKLYAGGVDEEVLRRITYATVMGLKTLKDEHNIIHRDVKPTNILANTRGQVKICDFGVSGNLVASIAKTNIGCQSYMAPERIKPEAMGAQGAGGTYSVQSDIWSLGLTIIECAMGRYPYPPEVASSVFSQLSVRVLIFEERKGTAQF
jgi:mitogen-activated protein kinase kinase